MQQIRLKTVLNLKVAHFLRLLFLIMYGKDRDQRFFENCFEIFFENCFEIFFENPWFF